MFECCLILSILLLVFKIEEEYYDKKKALGKLSFNSDKTFVFVAFLAILQIAYSRIYLQNIFLDPFLHLSCLILLLPTVLLVLSSKSVFGEGKYLNQYNINILGTLVSFLIVCVFPELFLIFYLRLQQCKNCLHSIRVGGYGDTDQKLSTHISFIYGACMLFAPFLEIKEVILSISMGVASCYYFLSALEKMKYDWVKSNKLKNIFFASKSQLNWSIIGNTSIINIICSLSGLVFFWELFIPLIGMPILIEDGTNLLILIFMMFLFHFFVFVSSGINFWKWKLTLLSMLMLAYTVNINCYKNESLYTVAYICSFIYTMKMSNIPIALGWLDSPLSKVYKIYFKYKGDKNVYRVRPYNIYPWDILISQNRLSFLFPDKKIVTGCLGAVRNTTLNKSLNSISELEQDEEAIIQRLRRIIEREGNCVGEQTSRHQTGQFVSFLKNIVHSKIRNQTMFGRFFDMLLVHIRDKREKKDLTLTNTKSGELELESVVFTFNRAFYSEKLDKIIEFDRDARILHL